MDRFAICQAFAQLESDYNVDGMLWERPSNRRRGESIGVQLHRIGYDNPYGWVDICAERDPDGDYFDEDVKFIYLEHVLKWDLPIDAEMMVAINRTFVEWYLDKFPQTKLVDYKQNPEST